MKIINFIMAIALFITSYYGQIITLEMQSHNKIISEHNFVEIAYSMDLTKIDEKLGSYSCLIKWNTSELVYDELIYSEVEGLSNPIANFNDVNLGELKIANANPNGNSGIVEIFSVRFKLLENSSLYSHKIEFTSLASAYNFSNLLSSLIINETITSLENRLSIENYSLEMYPNPFNPSIKINYQIPEESKVDVSIYNILGQLTAKLVNENKNPGRYELIWNGISEDGSSVSSGIYFLVLNTKSFRESKKIILLK